MISCVRTAPLPADSVQALKGLLEKLSAYQSEAAASDYGRIRIDDRSATPWRYVP